MRLAAPALLILLLTLSLAAQPLREVTTVEVVEVPVYVTAGSVPLTGLTREHFQLFVNGKPQSIDYFDVVDFAGLSAEEAQNPRQRRLYFLLFDLNSDPHALGRARKAVDEFVQQAGPADVFAVATLGTRQGLNVVTPFTRDRDMIRHAVRNLRVENGDPLRLAYVPQGDTLSDDPSRLGDSSLADEMLDGMMKELSDEPAKRQVLGTIGLLDQLARQLAPLEGHKHVVLLSTGFDVSPHLDIPRVRQIADVHQGPMMDLSSPITAKMQYSRAGAPKIRGRFMQALQDLTAQYSSASVFLDAIDIAGLRATWEGGNKDALYLLARTGQVVSNRNDLGDAIRYLTDRQRVVYVLGFRAQAARKNNKIRVELVNVPGNPRVSHRRSFSSSATSDSSSPLFLADIVTNDIPQNGFSVRTSVDVAQGGAATLSMTVPGRELLAFGGEQVSAHALLYIFSGERAVAFQAKQIAIDPKRARSLEDVLYGIRETFQLRPGSYTAKVLLHVDGTGARGFSRTDFVVTE